MAMPAGPLTAEEGFTHLSTHSESYAQEKPHFFSAMHAAYHVHNQPVRDDSCN
jgi:hypothetical protein